MKRWIFRASVAAVLFLFLSRETLAPLVYRPGEGWSYDPVGGRPWTRTRAKDQLEIAEEAFTNKNYSLCTKAARRTLSLWPLSDYAPRAQYLLARSYEARGQDERAFREYQKLIEKYPKHGDYEEVLQRQFDIANRFLGGQWFKLWGYVPFFPSMDKTTELYEKIIKSGPYSPVAAQSQMSIGTAREKQSDFPLAVKAYERAADRYHGQKQVAADALFKAGLAFTKQAKTADYDQNVAAKAIASFADFATLYPDDARVAEAEGIIASLKAEQARGAFRVAKFYEKRERWEGALVYYNEVLLRDPKSTYAAEAKERIEELKKRVGQKTAQITK